MNAIHQSILKLRLKLLQSNLSNEDLRTVLDHLYSEDVIDRTDEETISSGSTGSDKVSKLIYVLEKRGRLAYPILLEVLKDMPGKMDIVQDFKDTEKQLHEALISLKEYIPKHYRLDRSATTPLSTIQDDIRMNNDAVKRRFFTKILIETALDEIFPHDSVTTMSSDGQVVKVSPLCCTSSPNGTVPIYTHTEVIQCTVLDTATDVLSACLTAEDVDEIFTKLQVYDHVKTDQWQACCEKNNLSDKLTTLLDTLKSNRGTIYTEFKEILRTLGDKKKTAKQVVAHLDMAEEAVKQAFNKVGHFMEETFNSNPLMNPNMDLRKVRNEARNKCDRSLKRYISTLVVQRTIHDVFPHTENSDSGCPASCSGSVSSLPNRCPSKHDLNSDLYTYAVKSPDTKPMTTFHYSLEDSNVEPAQDFPCCSDDRSSFPRGPPPPIPKKVPKAQTLPASIANHQGSAQYQLQNLPASVQLQCPPIPERMNRQPAQASPQPPQSSPQPPPSHDEASSYRPGQAVYETLIQGPAGDSSRSSDTCSTFRPIPQPRAKDRSQSCDQQTQRLPDNDD